MGHGADCQVHICLRYAPAGSEVGWALAPRPPAGRTVLIPETQRWWEGCGWGRWVLLLWGWASCPPVCRPTTEEPRNPWVSAASLRTLLSLCLHPSFFWFCFFISDCCAQDCEYEKPPRSQHECKHTRVNLQDRACVQVYPTQQSRDLDPKVGFCLVLRASLGDLQKG